METVGFIGLGNMGGGMAGNIQKAGYPMVVYDLREEATRPFLEGGARLGNSPANVAERCDVTLTSLPGPREVELVATGTEGVLEGIRPGSVYIDLSTSRPTLIRELEVKFRAKGVHVLDAPVSGGKSGAQSRNLAVMVGGEREIFDRVKPLLDAFGDKVFLRRRDRRRLGGQARSQHDRPRCAAGHRRGPDPWRQGRRRPGTAVGVHPPRLAGPHERPA
ncbi:2-hydroxy-3-oxopropionate reductase [Geodia barretti]|uniref:3-hydroxyisobutyrate dehydrogenase n=1 Tax=Geodia barretti TaxID=519541 RepID=A0AA35WDZ8_GEOBA|nr:2-hydroxy-3-oxopropionate reductase [Geodia barretti]